MEIVQYQYSFSFVKVTINISPPIRPVSIIIQTDQKKGKLHFLKSLPAEECLWQKEQTKYSGYDHPGRLLINLVRPSAEIPTRTEKRKKEGINKDPYAYGTTPRCITDKTPRASR